MFEIHSVWVRLLCIAVFLVFLWFFVNSWMLGILNLGNMAGIAVCLAGILFFALNSQCAGLLKKMWQYLPGRIVITSGMALAAFCAVLAIFLSGCMLYTMHDTPKQENVLVVLGCKVRGGGPSLMLQHRLEAAYDYLEAHPDVQVIVCGGQGADESISEAQCMYEYLTNRGIAPERIVLEDTSTSTYENLRNAKSLLGEGEHTVTIVTDGFHQLRASMIADGIGLESDHISAKTSWYLVPTYWVREWFGICYQFVFG